MRGGLVYIDRLVRERPTVSGIVSATRGNHGQSLAFAGRAAGVAVTIVVPRGNSPDKNAAMRGFGAELIEHGDDFQASREHSVRLADQRGLETVPAFHGDLCRGVATYAHELFTSAGELDAVYVPALAGLLADRAAEPGRVDGRRIGVIVSGGNIDAPMLAEILAGRTPSP